MTSPASECLKPIERLPAEIRRAVAYVLTDIDDTLTVGGRLPAAAFAALEALQRRGVRTVPITGRPAGWCDHIARMWPVDGVVGENGAFYFRYDGRRRRMVRRYWRSAATRAEDARRLAGIRDRVLARVPGCRVSADQTYREADLAIDYCEDVPALPEAAVTEIVRCFEAAGAQAKVSSIHVNGWFGDYDKLAMSRRLFSEVFGVSIDEMRHRILYAGDSPNDEPMFAFFPISVGVANVRRFADRMRHLPAWVTRQEGGLGFAELVEVLPGPE